MAAERDDNFSRIDTREEDALVSSLSRMAPMDEVSRTLCDDLVLDILSRLPIKSLFRLKFASKSLLSLVHTYLPQSRGDPSAMLGYFYQRRRRPPHIFEQLDDSVNDSIDTSLSYLPCHPQTEIVDSCNGLVLCRFRPLHGRPRSALVDYYVCNPATKRWAALPHLPPVPKGSRLFVYLVYDPCISTHHKVFFASFGARPLTIQIFSSENQKQGWIEHNIGLHERILCVDPTIHTAHTILRCKRVLHFPYGFFSDGSLYITNGNHILRYSRLLQQDQIPHQTIIMLPYYSWVLPSFGILGGSICCACLDGALLRIWRLLSKGEDDASWVLKHSNNFTEHYEGLTLGVVVAFHPVFEVVLIQTKKGVFSYNLNSTTEFTEIHLGGLATETKIFILPYIPSYKDTLKEYA